MRHLLLLLVSWLGWPVWAGSVIPLEQIKLPPGFKISVFNEHVPGARSMALSDSGVLYVGTRKEGVVYAIKDGKVLTIAQGLDSPNGVAFRDGHLFVAEIHRILRFDEIEAHLVQPPQPVVVTSYLPKEGAHGWKFIRFSPDGWLYIPVGAPCNICEKSDVRFASILRVKPDGKSLEVFAHGIRNSVGFDWEPNTHELWFTENGRDELSDDLPSDELNHAPKKGLHFGFPYCHQGDTPDPDFGGPKHPCSRYKPPVAHLGAHVAALGMRFYTGVQFPAEYRGQIFIAEHGSWNRSQKVGYQVAVATLRDGKITEVRPFATGWLQGQEAWGRPVDVQPMPDGSLLISDDQRGVIYRIEYSAP